MWQYLSLTQDVLPRWDVLKARLGRQRRFWEYLSTGWRRDELATVTKLRDFKEFKRFLIERGGESTLVDVVVDRAPRVDDDQFFGRIRVHSLREIAANKLCTILSRGEPRDLVDLVLILSTGVDLPTAVKDAGLKEAALIPPPSLGS